MKKKEMIWLAAKENKSCHKQKVCYICKKRFRVDNDNREYHKAKDQCHYTGKYRGATHNIGNLRYKTPKKFLQYFVMVLHMTIIL